MDETRYESLLDENTNLKKALSSTKHILERTLNDYETLKQIHEDFKNQFDKVKRENEETSHKYLNALNDKKDLEMQFDTTIRNFKLAIEQKQRELEEVQAKVIPSLDHDMLRIKIINELEIPQRQAIEAKNQEIERLQDQVYELKRQVDYTNSKYENIRFEAEKDIRDLKERHKFEISDLMIEIQTLQERVEDTREKEIIRALRRELDEIKFRYDENENEMEELRREKEKLRDEKNDILIKLNKQVDVEKNEKRAQKAETDRLLIKVRQLENALNSFDNKSGDNEAELVRLRNDNSRLYQENDNKQRQINSLQNQIRDLEDGQISAQTKLQEYISQAQLQSHEKQISEKNRIASLQREIESYQKTIVDLENKYRTTNFQTTKDLESTKQEFSHMQDQLIQTQRNLEIKEEEVNKLKKDIDNLHNEMYYAQRKNKEFIISKDTASPATGVGHQGIGRDAELLREALRREEKLKNKVINLKAKLRMANKKIMELLPHKILGQKDTNIMARDPISAKSGEFGAYNVGAQGSLIDSLKAKYGIVDTAMPSLEPPVTDIKYISAKYGVGAGGQNVPASENNYRTEIDKLRSKYGYEGHLGKNESKEDELLHDEIERAANEGIRRFGLSPNKY